MKIKLPLVFTFFILSSLLMMSPKSYADVDAKKSAKNTVQAPQRNKTPTFKGVELYSWQEGANKNANNHWRFSLLNGTNRNKLLVEIQHKKTVISNVRLLKNQLAHLAVGESVFWSTPYPALTLPPAAMVDELSSYTKAQQINLVLPEALPNNNLSKEKKIMHNATFLHGKYLSKEEPNAVLVFTKEGKFGYVNPTKIDIYSTEKLPNKNIGEYTVAPNNEITFRFSESMQGFLPIKMHIENAGKTVIVEREKTYGDVLRKTAVYQLQDF
jgi:hypothetical protein